MKRCDYLLADRIADCIGAVIIVVILALDLVFACMRDYSKPTVEVSLVRRETTSSRCRIWKPPMDGRAEQLEGLFGEFYKQYRKLAAAKTDQSYDQALIRAWVTLGELRGAYSRTSLTERKKFLKHSKLFLSDKNKRKKIIIDHYQIRPGKEELADFNWWIKDFSLDTDGLTARGIYQNGEGERTERQQLKRLQKLGLVISD